jgi:DNA-binding MarR family transcriptional regulator
LQNVIVFDEGKKVWDRNKELGPAEGIPTITSIISLVREFGVGIVVADQDPWIVSQSLLDNSGTKLCLPLGSGKAVREMAYAMGLTPEQRDFLHRLQVGQACVRVAGAEPFLIVIPEVAIDKNVRDDEVRARAERLLGELGVQPRVQMDASESDEGLDNRASRMLEHIALHPLLSVTERFVALGLSAWAGERALDELIKAGLVTPATIHRGGRGGRAKYLELTPKARQLLQEDGVEMQWQGRGGIKHLYWQHRICESFRSRGYFSDIEVSLGDFFLDVFASDHGGRRIGVQVVTGELDSYEWVGFRKALEAGLDELFVACEAENAKQAIEARLPEMLGDVGYEAIKVVMLKELGSDPQEGSRAYHD